MYRRGLVLSSRVVTSGCEKQDSEKVGGMCVGKGGRMEEHGRKIQPN